jgi:predicted DNA-binding mobile mystery protein A
MYRMSPTASHLLTATQLDRKLPSLRESAARLRTARPIGGWIRAIRRALGMSTSALGRRLDLAQQSIVQLEKNEKAETITLASLRRVAAALDAELVYAIVPKKNLRESITTRAREVAAKRVASVAQSMKLESQGLADDALQGRIEELARELERRPRELWR